MAYFAWDSEMGKQWETTGRKGIGSLLSLLRSGMEVAAELVQLPSDPCIQSPEYADEDSTSESTSQSTKKGQLSCSYCNKEFTKPSRYKEHLLSHTGEV